MIYFVVALKDEISDFPFQKFLDEDYRVIYTGVGKINATLHLQEAILKKKPNLVINIGTAGTTRHQITDVLVCNQFNDGDLTEIKSAVKHIESKLPIKYEAIFRPKYSVMTKDTFSYYPEPITDDAVDMESFALARVCDYYSVPFVSIKVITDIIGYTSLSKWEEQLPKARKILLSFLKELNFEKND